MNFYMGSPTFSKKNLVCLPIYSPATHRWHHPAFSSLNYVTHHPHWLVVTNQTIMSCLVPLTIEDN
ncbi:hypothetical protein ES288_A08G042700v1 [Gossypium darwinii]|uniref:Uncharacterized protein n=1 Tax=Gossypium darwinii TaxID=34276 RepID=A0A5D2FHD4_GOSDA|nr:hypothetical protein ES288_A08G042700v1 [Gossypium darwinii]